MYVCINKPISVIIAQPVSQLKKLTILNNSSRLWPFFQDNPDETV